MAVSSDVQIKVNAETQKAIKALQDIQKALKQVSAETGDTEDSMNTLEKMIKRVSDNYGKQINILGSTWKAFDKLTDSIVDTAYELKNMTKGDVVKVLGDNIDKVATKFKGAASNAGGFVKTLGGGVLSGIQTSLKAIAVSVGAVAIGFAALAGSAIKDAIALETAFVGVMKTTDGLGDNFSNLTEEGRKLKEEFVQISNTRGINLNDVLKTGELAGQLGVASDQLGKFTGVLTDLKLTTDLVSEESALNMAQMVNGIGGSFEDIDRYGATIVDLGNKFGATESQILGITNRLTGLNSTANISDASIMAIGTTLVSTGVNAEAGGSAITRVFGDISSAVLKGGEKLEELARTSGVTSQEFRTMWENDAAGAFTTFIDGMSTKGPEGQLVLEKIFGSSVRVKESLNKLIGNNDMLSDSIEKANQAWRDNVALQEEVELRNTTAQVQMSILSTTLQNLKTTFGEAFLPVIGKVSEGISTFINNNKENVTKFFDETAEAITRWIDGQDWDSIKESIKGIGESFVEWVQNVDWEGFANKVVEIGDSFIKWVKDVDWGQLKDDIIEIKDTIVEWFDSVDWDAHIEQIKELKDNWEFMIPTVVLLVATFNPLAAAIMALTAIIHLARENWKVWSEVFSLAAENMKKAWGDFTEDISKKWDEFAKKVDEVWEDIKEAFNNWIEQTKEDWKALMDWFSEEWDKFSEKADEVWESIKEAVKNWIESVKEDWGNFKEWIKQKWDELLDHIVSFWDKVKSKILEWYNWVKSKFAELKNYIVEKFNQIKDKAIDAFNKIKDKLRDVINNMKDRFNDFKRHVDDKLNGIKDKFRDVRDTVKRIVQDLIDSIKRKFTAGVEDIKGKIASIGDISLPSIDLPFVGNDQGGTVGVDGTRYYATGGTVLGAGFKPKGTDTVPTMLTPGEEVTNRRSAEMFRPFLKMINNEPMKAKKLLERMKTPSQFGVNHNGDTFNRIDRFINSVDSIPRVSQSTSATNNSDNRRIFNQNINVTSTAGREGTTTLFNRAGYRLANMMTTGGL